MAPRPDVLVVEDDPDIRGALEDVLRESGYSVDAVTNGAEALVAMKASQPRMVLLDLMMPVVDGWQVMSVVDGDPELQRIPICILSAFVDRAPKSATCVLAKPIHVLPLLQTIERHCRRGSEP